MSQKAENLNSKVSNLLLLVNQVRDQVLDLAAYNGREEIDAYCDDLITQVTVSVESTIEQISKQGNKLLDSIDAYRKDLINGLSGSSATELSKSVQKLSDEILAFCESSNEKFGTKSDDLDSSELDKEILKAHDYIMKIGKTRQIIKIKTKENNKLVFKEFPLTSETYEYGRLENSEQVYYQQGETSFL